MRGACHTRFRERPRVKLHRSIRLRSSLLPRACALAFTLCALPAAALVAPGAALADNCPNAAFRTGPALHLPDCRAYELVTPGFKNGDAPFEGYLHVSPNGEAVGFTSGTTFAGAEANEGLLESVPYVSRRTEAGWTTTPLVPPASQFFEAVLELNAGFEIGDERTPDQLAQGWFLRGASQRENEIDLYLDRADGPLVDFGPALPPTAPAGPPTSKFHEPTGLAEGIRADALSADGSHVVFNLLGSAVAQWPGTGPGALLEYVGAGNTTPLLLGVEDNGKFIDECPTQTIEPEAISSDGSVAILTDPCDQQLYARVDNGQPGAHTVAISEPSLEDCAVCDTAKEVRQVPQWDDSSVDGLKVFFTTKQPLLDGSTEANLYEYDFDAPAGQRIVRVTAGDATVSNPPVGLRNVVTVSEDGSHVYFVAGGVLTETPNDRGEVARQGAENLYVYERDTQYPGGRTVFVATMNENEPVRQPQTTPDGRFLVFVSATHLTPDDRSSGGQVFEYDSQTGAMVRISVGQDGYNDDGNSPITAELAAGEGRVVSADGSYVFFQSSVGLTPQALNRVPIFKLEVGFEVNTYYANNVYEYHDGNVSLISDGQDIAVYGQVDGYGLAVKLVGTDLSGDNVFFTSADQLVAQDTNSNVDVYDARIGGGYPAPTAPAECQGDACQGEVGAAPVLLSPGSEFQAAGEDFSAEEPRASGASKAGATKSKPKSKRKQAKTKRKARRSKAKLKRGGARRAGRVNRVRVSGGGNGGRS
jgi:hypothetical protein